MSSTAISDAVIPYPFSDSRTFALCIGSLELRDIGRAARVCKDWNRAIKSNELWQSLFKREGIPLVKSLSGSPRDLRADFKVLYPITISARAISRFFGNIVGQVPDISEKWLMKLNDPDPFERSKTIGENFVFVVIPSLITRTADKKTPLFLDESTGELMESPKLESSSSSSSATSPEQDITIPLSLKNITTLCAYPLQGEKNKPVFGDDIAVEVFREDTPCLDKVRVYLMRKSIVERSAVEPFEHLEKFAQDKGFEITPLRERAWFDAYSILASGKCPDGHNTFAITSTYILHRSKFQTWKIGDFTPERGVDLDDYQVLGTTGVVPGVPVAVFV